MRASPRTLPVAMLMLLASACATPGDDVELCACSGRACTHAQQVPTPVQNLCAGGVPDGLVEGFEQCDDNNLDDTDGCTSNCRQNLCVGGTPDGWHAIGEPCDDGDLENLNACTNYCTVNICGDGFAGPGQPCDDANDVEADPCRNDCVWNVCGDGELGGYHDPADPSLGVETCDDGNAITTDACPDGPGGTCDDAHCGDGFLWDGLEECDPPGTPNPQDPAFLCSAICTWVTCGNGSVQAGEQCDLGSDCGSGACNRDDGACTTQCTSARCGDGFVRTDIADPGAPDYEACDSGDLNSDLWSQTPHCRSDCSGLAPHCGDGMPDTLHEQCDDGTGDGTGWQQDRHCLSDCSGDAPHCGDEILQEAYEVCDDGTADGDGWQQDRHCLSDCSGDAPHCTDGIFDSAHEECDDGPSPSADCNYGQTSCQVCSTACTLVPGATSYCNDGFEDAAHGEECDKGSHCAAGACNGPTRQCTPACKNAICGDGYRLTECDLAAPCAKEWCDLGLDCSDNQCNGDDRGCTLACEWNVCGDGKLLVGTEICDDGANNGLPGHCRPDCSGRCGDGVTNGIEECDDGNSSNNDGCLTTCVLNTCGDLYPWLPSAGGTEECDDGNASNNDRCLTTCERAKCGDGYVRTGSETCDHGGFNGAYGYCASDCQSVLHCGDGICQPEEQGDCSVCRADCAGSLACSDGNACTVNDVCQANGTCAGTTKSCPNSYGAWSVCSYSSTCDERASKRRTVYIQSCRSSDGACVASSSSQQISTSGCPRRDTDGDSCGRRQRCRNGSCVSVPDPPPDPCPPPPAHCQ